MMGAIVDGSASSLIASAIATETGIPAAQIKVSVSKAAATVVKVELPQNGAHTLAQKVQVCNATTTHSHHHLPMPCQPQDATTAQASVPDMAACE